MIDTPRSRYLHATALVIGETGLLILGESGAGKSALADRLIAEAGPRGLFAALIGDDRIAVTPHHGRLIASGHPDLAGRIERRGEGIGPVRNVASATLRLAIQLENAPERLPETAFLTLEGLSLPLLRLRADEDLVARTHRIFDRITTHSGD